VLNASQTYFIYGIIESTAVGILEGETIDLEDSGSGDALVQDYT
jgi:hypothetical protein